MRITYDIEIKNNNTSLKRCEKSIDTVDTVFKI